MNKYLTFPGLQPVYLGDIDFLQESVQSAFAQLLKGLTGQEKPRCILLEATETNDGVICFDGEILPLKYSQSGIASLTGYVIEANYSGERVFKSGESNKCYEERYVKTVTMSYDNPDNAINFPTLAALIKERMIDINSSKSWSQSDNNDANVKYMWSRIGKVYNVVGSVEIKRESTLTELTSDLGVPFPPGNYHFPIICELLEGTLKSIPAKMEVSYNEEQGVNVAAIRINSTRFNGLEKGSFSINIVG